MSIKQKVNTRISTESELVRIDDVIALILWKRLFAEAQGFIVKTMIAYRDNLSSIKLELNSKESSGKKTHHFNIKYFYVTDLIKRNLLEIIYCPTKKMVADYMSKLTTRETSYRFKNFTMNFSRISKNILESKL